MLYIKFFIFAVLIIISGFKLSQYGQILSKKTIFSEALFGMIFLAIVTSLPELITSIGAVTIVDAPNMAASNVFGSILINLMIIAILDFIQGKGGILSISDRKHILTLSITTILLGLIVLSILFRSITNIQFGFFNIGLDSILIFLVYLFCVKLVYRHSQEPSKKQDIAKPSTSNLWNLWFKFCLFAGIIVISGIYLAKLGDEITIKTGLSQTFVGLVFLAVATSLPELIVSISALRLGSVDMALGNILGSNLFDTAIIPLTDAFYRKGELLSSLSISHIFTLSLCILFSTIIISGLTYRSKKSFLKLGWDIIAMIIIFMFAVFFFCIIK